MKEAGAGGDAILDALASNSATFDGKTQFAQVCRLCLPHSTQPAACSTALSACLC